MILKGKNMINNNTKLSVHTMAVCSLFTALIAIGAFVKIPFPVVPLTLQTLFVVLAGMVLGARKASISVGLYLFIGLIGFPIFTKGGGPGYVLQPTFGYLMGFLAAAFVAGVLSDKINATSLKSLQKTILYFLSGLSGIVIIYAIGMVYLYFIMNYYTKNPIGFISMFTFNLLIMTIGDVFKCLVAALIASRIIPILKKSFAKKF